MKNFRKNEIGITLIALVITIVILLILAGIVISSLTGDNGLFKRAKEARTNTLDAQNKENTTLQGYEDAITSTVGVDWEYALANATKHPDQKTSTAIGVGTDGKPVNMDLWEYTKLDNGTYALNGSYSEGTAGYKGKIIDGQIEGTIPQYIKVEGDNNFIEITTLQYTFYQKTELVDAPELPDSITNLSNTFNGCTNLKTVGEIPDNVTNMQGTFNGCTSLTTITDLPKKLENMSWIFQNCTSLNTISNIPSNVTNMQGTFNGCTSLEKAPNIPSKVENMDNTFYGCTNLTTVNTIPKSVKSLKQTFQGCSKLQGEIEINANIIDIANAYILFYGATQEEGITLKLKGSCPVLAEIVTNAKNSNITL